MNAATSSGYAAPAAPSSYEYAYLKDFDVAVAVGVAVDVDVAIDVGVDVNAHVDGVVGDGVVADMATRPEESVQASEAAGKWCAEEAAKLISSVMPALTIESNSKQSSLSATATAATAAAAMRFVHARSDCTNTQRLLINTRGLNQINLKSSQSSDQVHGSNNSGHSSSDNKNHNKNNNSVQADHNSNNRKSPTLSKQLTPTTQTTTTMPVTIAMSSVATTLRKSLSTPASFKIGDVACDSKKPKDGVAGVDDDGGGGGGAGGGDAAVAAGTDHSNQPRSVAAHQHQLQSTLATTTTTSINTTIDGVTRLHSNCTSIVQSQTALTTMPPLQQQQQQRETENVAAPVAADSHSASEAPAQEFDLDQRFGCAHYKRRAMFVTPCCNKFYKCRFCHDENETHHFDRKTLTELICSECNTRQAVQERCEHCATRFGKYTCLICNLFDDTDKQQYHCNGCGICRIGGADNFFHCEVCDMCLPIRLQIDGHRCVENISRSHCPVCLGDIHTSRIPCHIPDCGHLLHKTCFDQLLNSGHYACPICQTSLIDMTALWEYLDAQAVSLPIPKKYENQRIHIFCNDCHKTSKTKFNFIGLKCMQCGAYNTTQDVKRRMSLVTDEPSSA